MKNITVTVPDEVYRRARIRAAERGRSVSALVTDFLRHLDAGDTEFARLEALERATRAGIGRFRAADRLERDEVHRRALR